MNELPKIVVMGAGNVAFQFATSFYHAGLPILAIISPNPKNALQLSKLIGNPQVLSKIELLTCKPDLLLIAVKDDVLTEIASQLPAFDGWVAHTSGTIPISVFKNQSSAAVLYPLQTLNKLQYTNPQNIPILVETNAKQTRKFPISVFANVLGKPVYNIPSDERLKYHLSAVFMANFANVLWDLGQTYMDKNNLNHKLLVPLLQQALQNAIQLGAHNSQTGPAKRKDISVLTKHIELLQNEPILQKTYKQLSDLIEVLHP